MYNDLVKWINKNGGSINKSIYLNKNEAQFSSIYLKKDNTLDAKSLLTKIPKELSITEDTFNKIPNSDKYLKYINNDSQKFKVILSLIYEILQKEKSFYFPYIKTLPKTDTFNTHPVYLYYINDKTFKILEPLLVDFTKIINRKANELEEIIKDILSFNEKSKLFSIKDEKLKELVIYSYFILLTRSWSNQLIPFNDNFNHSQESNISLTMYKKDFNYMYSAKQNINKSSKDSEILINYGHYSLMDIQTYYNYLPENSIDYLRIIFTLSSNNKFENLKILEIKKCNFNHKRLLLSNVGASKNLFSILRILSLDENEYKIINKKSIVDKCKNMISYKNELRSVRLLIKIILDLKKSFYSLDLMCETKNIIDKLANKKSLSSAEVIINNICIIKTKEYAILDDSLAWANERLLNLNNSLQQQN